MKLSQEVGLSLKVTLGEALPNTWLLREGLMEDITSPLVACGLIAVGVINHLVPTVSLDAEAPR